ncbi:unnamed protein product [Heterotrigona itama]|uniref:C2H2-type domain-containing protein n=1 Tax=Heterotrigona itama TaxID=395501 RepID=A0A6V7GRY9_9HYME|nr:unnamed protein product [Heterotrigona itama]
MNIEGIAVITEYKHSPKSRELDVGRRHEIQSTVQSEHQREDDEKRLRIRHSSTDSKFQKEGKYPVVLPLQLRKKQCTDSKMPQYTVISEKNDYNENDDGMNFSEQRALRFECNFCHEQIATLLSLSTHIKFHRRTYCKYCYWILPENETMEEHIENTHRIDSGIGT